MAKKKKFRFPWFALFMVLYAVVFLLATKHGLEWFWGYMEAFELSQPEHAIEHYMDALSNEDLYADSAALISQLDSNLITETECHAMIDRAVSGGITYAKNNKESTSERYVYMLLSGDRTIGKVVTEPGTADENGFRIWSATEDSFDFSFLMGTGTSITVPHHLTVSVNGKPLDESYITESNIPFKALIDYYDDYENLPYLVTYATPAIWGSQALLVTDDEGNVITIDESTDLESLVYTCSQEEIDRIQGFATDFIGQYMTFVSCSSTVRRQEYKEMISYIVDGTALEDRMYEAMDGLQWSIHKDVELISITFNSCILLEEGRYLCDLTYVSESTKFTGRTQDTTNAKIILVESGGKLLAESMQNY